jgi:7,8-dihydropterin-6-yl-methyl-4-(beta-D-ribofuranosyl)aminobenzene 5'-phosphate synthase
MNRNCEVASDQSVPIREVDGAEIISLIDNSVDVSSTIEREEVKQVRTWVKERKGEKWVKEHPHLPMAEHGFSMLIRVFRARGSHSMLFDVGSSPEGVVINAGRMGLNLSEVESIILSHGHYDHCGGLLKVLQMIRKENLPIIAHEDMFKTRGVAEIDGTIRRLPDIPKDDQVKPARYVKTKRPYLSADNTVLVTGEIPRKTDFEKGFPRHRVLMDGKWQPEPWIWDDRALVINIKHKGLLILSGCAHAGIINTILYSQQITGIRTIYAVLGGFHLAGKEYESRIDETVKKVKQLKPSLVAPSHCTGWKGAFAIAKAMPQAFVWSSVGNLYQF